MGPCATTRSVGGGGLTMLARAASAGVALAVVTAPAAVADDDCFLAELNHARLTYRSAGAAVAAAHAVCELMDAGSSPIATANAVHGANPAVSLQGAARFVVLAVGAYCPDHL